MRTPISDFIREYLTRGATKLHMPGHKGRFGADFYSHDITEIEGADVLYSPTGIIKESEELCASLFGTARTLYSTEGSSLAIRGMLALVSSYAKKRGQTPRIIAARNAHKTVLGAVALLGISVEWLPSANLVSAEIDCDTLTKTLARVKPHALLVTSPDYLGHVLDVKRLAEICHGAGVLLLVDNAHGAYLKFMPRDTHPITLGADLCCDSAHKTLPVLTGGAYLHISKNAPADFTAEADDAMALFASTSPSYLILESLDSALPLLAGDFSSMLARTAQLACGVKKRLSDGGYTVLDGEAMKITLAPKGYGYLGEELGKMLAERGFVPEFCDRDFLVLMVSPFNTEEELLSLCDTLLLIKRREKITETPPKMRTPERVCEVKDALLCPYETVSVTDAIGRTAVSEQVLCPPAVSVLLPGERIGESAVKAMLYYGIKSVRVMKK